MPGAHTAVRGADACPEFFGRSLRGLRLQFVSFKAWRDMSAPDLIRNIPLLKELVHWIGRRSNDQETADPTTLAGTALVDGSLDTIPYLTFCYDKWFVRECILNRICTVPRFSDIKVEINMTTSRCC